jgi:hypothetical protein
VRKIAALAVVAVQPKRDRPRRGGLAPHFPSERIGRTGVLCAERDLLCVFMADYDPAAYGDRIADEYDEWSHTYLQTDATIERLAELAGGGPVLELGIGTGRATVPLAARGLTVYGVEASETMVAKLREKPAESSYMSRSATSQTRTWAGRSR